MATLTASQATYFSDGSSTNPDVGFQRPKKRSRINGLSERPLKRITRSQLTKQHTTAEKVPSEKSTTSVHSSQQGGTHQTGPKRGAPRGKPKPTSTRCKPKAKTTKGSKKPNILKNNNKSSYHRCLECSYVVKSFKVHFGLTKRRPWFTCNQCKFKTKCKWLSDRHNLLSSCNTSNVVRRPFGRLEKPSSSTKLLHCSSCKVFSSISFQELYEHLSMCKGSQVFKTKLETEIAKEELDEVKLFGSINLSGENIKLKNDCETVEGHKEENLEVKDEIKEYFSQFLPLSRLNNINPLMVKHLYENENKNNEGNGDDKLKKIKLALLGEEKMKNFY
uniref:Uncharacterized protein n=1 Tax=Meloidogyne enterolobii TaxID=390850 RepID=A0A6V7V6Q2_MELEN|nr:unnamed protein product [Meloidogyne enterolobii]